MRVLTAALVLLVLPLMAGTAGAQDSVRDERLESILKRAGSKDPFTAYLALKDFDQWREGVPDVAARVGALRAGATGARLAGIEAALDHLNPKPEPPEEAPDPPREPEPPANPPITDPAALRALALQAEAEAAVDGDLKHCWELLRAAASPDAFQPGASRRALEGWANEEPEKVRRLAGGFRTHPVKKVSACARDMVGILDGVIAWLPVSRALDTLGIPSVRNCNRVRVSRSAALLRVGTPGYGGEFSNGWLLQRLPSGSQVLFDDGCVRSGAFDCRPDDLHDGFEIYRGNASLTPSRFPHGEDGFWRALLFSRWAGELGDLTCAVACREAAQAIAAEEWPLEEPEKLAARVLRRGADRLLAQAEEDLLEGADDRLLTARLAALPFDECRKAGDEGIARWKRVDQGERDWGNTSPEQADQGAMRRRVQYWTWRLVKQGVSKDLRLADLIDAADAPSPSSQDPVERLAALGWDSLPFVIERLDDRASIGPRRGGRALTLADVCIVILARTFGRRLPTSPDPVTGWPALTSPVDEVQADLLGRWEILGAKDEPARVLALYREGSPRATEWLFAHDPAACAREEFERLAPGGRRRDLGVRRLEQRLAVSPTAKLEELRDSCEGELWEIVERALASQAAPSK